MRVSKLLAFLAHVMATLSNYFTIHDEDGKTGPEKKFLPQCHSGRGLRSAAVRYRHHHASHPLLRGWFGG